MEQNGQTARWGTGLDHHRTLGWPSCEHIGVMIVGVLGQPAELRRSQGGKRAGRSANRGWTSLGGQGFHLPRDWESCSWASLPSPLVCGVLHVDRAPWQ